MSAYITDGTTTVYPAAVEGFSSERVSGARVHAIVGRSYPDVTYQPAQLRNGTLTIVSTDRATINFSYIVTGTVRRTFDTRTRAFWRVEVDFQEVAA